MRVKTTPVIVEPPATRSVALNRIALDVVESGAAPAASCAAGFRDRAGWHFGVGAAGTLWPNSLRPVTPDTLFDLASLTKPIHAVAVATESILGALDWWAALQEFLPEVRGTWAATSSFESLLSHRAGLVPHVELYRRLQSGLAIDATIAMRMAANAKTKGARRSPEQTPALYSDLGYLLSGLAIERRFGIALDCWLALRLPRMADCFGSARQWLARDPGFRARCAATEVVPWRGGLLCAQVHDENAWALRGHGLCGHAGLFGTALGIARFGAAVLDALAGGSEIVPEQAATLTTGRRPSGTLCAGFDRKSEQGSSAGAIASSDAFGHLGFTGTSLWCDPRRAAVTVMLSNRVCPNRANGSLRPLRPRLHDSLFKWATSREAD